MGYTHPYYNSKRWKLRRLHQLNHHPLCVMCLQTGTITAATVADHVIPHKESYELFFFGELQSLCAFHHNKTKQRFEHNKGNKKIDVQYSSACDVNGKPIDPNHPSLKG